MIDVPESLTLRFADSTQRKVRRRWARGNLIGIDFVHAPLMLRVKPGASRLGSVTAPEQRRCLRVNRRGQSF